MYTLIFEFLRDNLFSDLSLASYHMEIMGVDTTMSEWLSHSLTIVSMVLIFIFFVWLIKWLFKLLAGLIRW